MKAEPGSAPRGTRVIKRYANRKLYDPSTRRYVTLDGIATLVARGEDVEIVDQASGEDLTNLVLAQVLLEGVRQRSARVPRQVLARLIRLAGAPGSQWGHWPEPREVAGRAGDEAERIAGRFLARARPTLEDAVALREEVGQLVHRLVAEAQSGLETRLRGLLQIGEGAAGRSLEALWHGLNVFEERTKPRPPRTRRQRTAARGTRSRALKR
jgi:polyhydroxyalkanoate synthesis repressor PhaR